MKIANLLLLVTRFEDILSGFGQIAATRLRTGERNTLRAVTVEVSLRELLDSDYLPVATRASTDTWRQPAIAVG
jgi:hypothetical protein